MKTYIVYPLGTDDVLSMVKIVTPCFNRPIALFAGPYNGGIVYNENEIISFALPCPFSFYSVSDGKKGLATRDYRQ